MNPKQKYRIRAISVWFGAICWICCSCSGKTPNAVPDTNFSVPAITIDSTACGPVYDLDSLHTVLVGKLGPETRYVPIIRFLVDSLVPQYNFYQFDSHSKYLFAEPLRYMTWMKLDEGRSLVTLTEDNSGESYYFLLDVSNSIVWHQFFNLYRTRILKREFRDWEGNGKKEVVEVRENIVSGFVGTKEYVFSVGENGLELRFCIALSEASYIGADSSGGYLTRRSYKRLGSGLYHITERKSLCDEEGKPHGEVSITQYTISADSLITLYDDREK